MIQNIIKKVLQKWLKKKLFSKDYPLSVNVARFKWVYDSPLYEWRDRIWVVTHNQYRGLNMYDSCIDYLTNNSSL